MSKDSKSPKKKRGNVIYNIVLTLIIIAGLLVLLYPTISDRWNKYLNSKLITDYDNKIASIPKEDFSEMYAAAKAYNDQHKKNTVVDAFTNEDYILHHPYDTLLNPLGNQIMGSIEIPKIHVNLAIGHGTGPEILEQGVGHIEGTSLPIGGPSTHSVLSAHRGLPAAKLFTDLDQIKVGDKFFLHMLGEVLAYEVDKITIVEPTQIDELAIIEGEDLVTLVTCEPYGVNSHRMLVRGHRIPFVEEDVKEQKAEFKIAQRDLPVVLAASGMGVLLLIVLIMAIVRAVKSKKARMALIPANDDDEDEKDYTTLDL